MNAQIEALEVPQEIKDAMESNPDVVLSESLKLAYKQGGGGNQPMSEKIMVKKLAQKLKQEPKFSKYTDKQLKEIVKANLKTLNDRKMTEITAVKLKREADIEAERLRMLNSTAHIVDIEL